MHAYRLGSFVYVIIIYICALFWDDEYIHTADRLIFYITFVLVLHYFVIVRKIR